MNSNTTYTICGLALIILSILCVNISSADSLVVYINSAAITANDDLTGMRLIMQFDLPEELTDKELIFAEMTIPIISQITDSSALELFCNPLLIGLELNEVEFEDVDDSSLVDIASQGGTVFATPAVGNQTAYFDITNIVRAWADSSLADNGLIFYVTENSIPTFGLDNDAEAVATVKFIYNQ